MIRVFFLSIGSVSLLLAGCSIYDSSLTTHGPKGSGGTNGSGGDDQGGSAGQSSGGATEAGGSSNGGAAGAACNSKTYPPPPLNKGLGGDIEIVAIQAGIVPAP